MLFVFSEQRAYEGENKQELLDFQRDNPDAFVGLPKYMKTPVHLGIDGDLNAAYYIGADWLKDGEDAVVVLPNKLQNVDYVEMFIKALSVNTVAEVDYFSKCYGISYDKPFIDAPNELNQLTPLLLIHYIMVLQYLVKQGVRKDYVSVEENLKTKIKGHILLMPHLNKNVIPKRYDRAYCRYQIYTEDIPVNRLLKKALLFAEQMFMSLDSLSNRQEIQGIINSLISRFDNISDDVSISEVRNINGNKLFRFYAPAVKIAIDILRRYDYSITEINKEPATTPPFWIDIARLFEMYLLSKLNQNYPGQIKFQVKGHLHTQVDYIHVGEQIIIDAKYKPRYNYTIQGIVDDIREISGYARDSKILSAMNVKMSDNDEIHCLIIYPVADYGNLSQDDMENISEEELNLYIDFLNTPKIEDFNNNPLWDSATQIPGFRNFRKISVPLPVLH